MESDCKGKRDHTICAPKLVLPEGWRRIENQGRTILELVQTRVHLSAGEDVELCDALREEGWRLWYDPSVRLEHFLPGRRLTWSYPRRLARGAGTVGQEQFMQSEQKSLDDALSGGGDVSRALRFPGDIPQETLT